MREMREREWPIRKKKKRGNERWGQREELANPFSTIKPARPDLLRYFSDVFSSVFRWPKPRHHLQTNHHFSLFHFQPNFIGFNPKFTKNETRQFWGCNSEDSSILKAMSTTTTIKPLLLRPGTNTKQVWDGEAPEKTNQGLPILGFPVVHRNFRSFPDRIGPWRRYKTYSSLYDLHFGITWEFLEFDEFSGK